MPWDRTTQQLHKRPDDHGQNDLTDAEWTVIGPMPPTRAGISCPRDAGGARHPLDIHRFPPAGTIFTHGGGAGSGTSRGGVRGAPRSRPPPRSTAGR